MVYHGVCTVLYLTAFITNAASVHPFYFHGHLAAAAVSFWHLTSLVPIGYTLI